MFARGHLTLQLVRLKSPEEWAPQAGQLHFLFPKGGAAKCVSGSMHQRFGAGDAMVLNGDSGGKVCLPQGGEVVFWVFSLCLEHLFPLFGGNEIALLQNVTESLQGLKHYPASSPVALECHRLVGEVPPQFNLDHRSQLLRVAAVILAEEFKTAQRYRVGFVRIEEHLVQVFERLSADELLSLPVGELASRFGCSRRHLNRLFHQFFGFSVAALKMEMRLLKAVSLLRHPDAKVINVADECGFNHLGLFNTCFKRRFGVSPGQWRKMKLPVPPEPVPQLGAENTCPLRGNGLCPIDGGARNLTPFPPMAGLIKAAAREGVLATGAGTGSDASQGMAQM